MGAAAQQPWPPQLNAKSTPDLSHDDHKCPADVTKYALGAGPAPIKNPGPEGKAWGIQRSERLPELQQSDGRDPAGSLQQNQAEHKGSAEPCFLRGLPTGGELPSVRLWDTKGSEAPQFAT